MKKIMVCLIGLVVLTACNSVEADYKERFTEYDEYLSITQDTKTGCKYIIYDDGRNQASITPLLKSDGTPNCDK